MRARARIHNVHAPCSPSPPRTHERRQGVEKAKAEDYDAVIVDTAGRLQIDEGMMGELKEVRLLAWFD